ncbi:MAG: hypothetical protein QM765_21020 [Myxococcales bacterium]
MNAARFTATIPVPLTQDVVDRADALLKKADRLPEFAVSRLSRAAVLRLAIMRGLDVLEQEVKGAGRG